MQASQRHTHRSSHREVLLEHLFSGEVMKRLWHRGEWRLEVLKPQVDDGGYDLVLEANSVVRHVQLKSSYRGSKARETEINILLRDKPSGCVVFVWFDKDTLELGPFEFLGGLPGEQLPDPGDRIARHTRANAHGLKAHRPGIRKVSFKKFVDLKTIDDVVDRLFGTYQDSVSV